MERYRKLFLVVAIAPASGSSCRASCSSGVVLRSMFRGLVIFHPVHSFLVRHWHPFPVPGYPEAFGIAALCWWVSPC